MKLEAKELKKGLLIWWIAKRSANGWNCPGIITNVSKAKNEFTVLTFDDFVESTLPITTPAGTGSSPLDEMRTACKTEVEKYISWQKSNLKKGSTQLKNQLLRYKGELDRYIKKADRLTL